MSPEHKALLLHELGVIEERAGDEMGAAREFLAAFNSHAHFREPLEGLVRLLERRKSVKNLPKLLDALLRAAESPVERSRALVKRASFCIDYGKDDRAGRSALLSSTTEQPADPTPWLELETLAGRTTEPGLRVQALEARAKLEKDPTWRALLFMALADVVAKQGEADQAIGFLDDAIELEGSARFRAAQALERHAALAGRKEALARALEAQAELLITALGDPAAGDRFGVPRSARQVEMAADAWLRAAEARRPLGDWAATSALLDRALERVGPRPVILMARLAVAEGAGDTATAERIAETLLDQNITGPSAASLFMRVAEAAANRDDAAGALAALTKALEADPGCIPARALQIDLLGNATDAPALAAALQAMAGELPTEEAKARAFLLAAYVFAVQARDVAGAKAALAEAGACGLPPALLARVARSFAAMTDDGPWYEDATQRLADGAQDGEQVSLSFELGRGRLLRGDQEAAARAFEAIAHAPGGAWLGRALSAYALGHGPAGNRADAATLDRFRAAETDPQASRALALAAAFRAARGGDLPSATARLRELSSGDPTDVIAAAYLAELEKRSGRTLDAAKVLANAAGALGEQDVELGAALHLEAAILLWRSGERRVALDELEAALASTVTPAAPLFGWALRGVDAVSSDERKRLLDRAIELSDDKRFLTLSRVALQLLAPSAEVAAMRSLLETLEEEGEDQDALGSAAALARVLWDEKGVEREKLLAAVARVARESPRAAALAAWESLRLARLGGDRELAGEQAQALAHAMPSLPADLEWFGAAMGAGHRAGEVAARRRIARALTGETRSAVLASAALVSLIDAPTAPQPLLPDNDAHARLMNLELALPGREARRRARAFSALGDSLGEDARFDALTMAGYGHLAVGDAEKAMVGFETVVARHPADPFAWEGLRSAAEALGDIEKQARACAALGDLMSDDGRGAKFWEDAALLHIEALKDEVQGEAALERAFARDPSRAVAFDRLFRRVRQRGESEKLLGLIARRLEVAQEPDELVKLFWERARVLRQQGDREGAIDALENVTMIEPDHVGALALKGEIDITQSNFTEAAESLSRLATLRQAPAQQRLMSGVAAVDLYENKLNDTSRALEVLVALYQDGLSTLPVRERMARAAAKTGSWSYATTILEELMKERATSDGRVEAARLAMAIWRDKLKQPRKAEAAVKKLLDESAEDGEALDLALETDFDPAVKKQLLARGRGALVDSLAINPIDRDRIARLARVAKIIGDWPLRQATLGALRSLSGPDSVMEQELSVLDGRVARLPQVAVDQETVSTIGDPDDTGALPQLFAALAEAISGALGPSLEGLGVGKKNRIDPRAGLPLRNEIAAWAGALGLGEFDVYVGGTDPQAVHGVAGEIPALVVGSGVTAPLTPAGRQAIVRELFSLRRGISVTRTRDDTTVAAIVVAACNLAEVRIESPSYAMLSEVQRLLGKSISRRTKRVLPDLCRAVVAEQRDIRAWARAAQASMYRMATIAAGDVALVLTDALGVPLARLPATIPHDDRARRLIAFALSPRYLELRERLGMGVT